MYWDHFRIYSFGKATDNDELNIIANHDLIPIFLGRISLMFFVLNERLLRQVVGLL